MSGKPDTGSLTLGIASGKGGTGKTTLSVNLALTAPGPVCLLDADVEEPNAHLFLDTRIDTGRRVTLPVPEVDAASCTACGKCSEICQFNAIACLKSEALVFAELCHGCGGCAKVCPSGAIHEVERGIGDLDTGRAGEIDFARGRLDVGQTLAPPLVRAVKGAFRNRELRIVDCPPGTGCPVVAALRDCDFVLLVTEPTPFGLHDLTLAVDLLRELGLAFAVVINRCDSGDDRVLRYCRAEGIEVLLEIPDDRRIAEAYSRGEPMVKALPEMRATFEGLWQRLYARRTRGEAS